MLSVTSDYLSPKTLFSFKPFSKATSADGKHAVLNKGDMAWLRGGNADWMTLTEDKPELTQGDDDPAEEVLLLVYVLCLKLLLVLPLSLVFSSIVYVFIWLLCPAIWLRVALLSSVMCTLWLYCLAMSL